MILQTYTVSVEVLHDGGLEPPPVEALRPACCPGCGQLAHEPGKRLGIVGHGTYTRQVLGVALALRDVLIRVRRYLCRGCARTIVMLPAVLHPGRWYGAGIIIEALRRHLVDGQSARQVRESLGIQVEDEGWRSLRRWRRQLLSALWGWLARTLGAKGEASTRGEGRVRLQRLLSEAGLSSSTWGGGMRAAPLLLAGRVHARATSWMAGQPRPEPSPLKDRLQ